MITQNTDGSQTIQASDLIEYSLELQSLVKQGYSVQVTNDEAPILIGYMCVATLKKECLADSVAEMQVKIVVDAQQAIDEITKIAQETGQYNMTPEQECKAVEAVEKAVSVEPTVKKPSGRPKANKGA